MRPIILAIPSLMALACAGGLLAVAMRARSERLIQPVFEPRHLVTTLMTLKTEGMAGRTATNFKLTDVNGRKVEIGGLYMVRPQFVYFVHTDCPCSYAAEPLFHALAKQFAGKIDFVSITNGSVEKTKKWIKEMDVDYPVVSDPKVEVMKAFAAESSAYSALIAPNGKIDRMWPGFSRDLLLDMNQEMSEVISQPVQPFDTQYAPAKPATGCSF